MRPTVFAANSLRQFLRKNHVATLPQLKHVLGTPADITVFRKLRELSYHTSYSHRGGFYTLEEIAEFDRRGLWSFGAVRFSRYGTLLATAENFVTQAPAGYFASELEAILQVPVKEPLLQLIRQGKIVRHKLSGLYLYGAGDREQRQRQGLARQALRQQPIAGGLRPRQVSDEVRAAIILFVSLLNEQQRRLYAGLESLQLGRGGDRQIAELLRLDAHTVAKGRKQLLAQKVVVGRARHGGGGRKRAEKKRLP